MRRVRNSLLAILLAACLPAHAVVKAPAWTVDLGNPVRWQQMTMAGTLLVATRNELRGLDAATGQVVWRLSGLETIDNGGFEEIPGTALIVLADGRDDTRIVVLDALKGTMVFDSRAENLVQILDKRVLAKTGNLLIAGFETGKPETTLFMYDIASGKRRWRSSALHSGKGKMVTFLTAVLEAIDLYLRIP